MAATMIWDVTRIECYPQKNGLSDVVVEVSWVCVGTQTQAGDLYTDHAYGSTTIPYDSASPFTPYANLTSAQVLGWCWASGVDKNAIEAEVQQRIDNKITPPTVSLAIPWA
jgi:hypothetical protein